MKLRNSDFRYDVVSWLSDTIMVIVCSLQDIWYPVTVSSACNTVIDLLFFLEKRHRSSRAYTSVTGCKVLEGRRKSDRGEWKARVGHLDRGPMQRVQWHGFHHLRAVAHGTGRYRVVLTGHLSKFVGSVRPQDQSRR